MRVFTSFLEPRILRKRQNVREGMLRKKKLFYKLKYVIKKQSVKYSSRTNI
uniref:Uncharacterized protein n=1 Tax=Ciona intestinalis TaxID=7719 RepID=H2XQP4_CIOIN